jgi:glycine/D-amino acid oxidase-like deaminating enzyme
MKPTSGVTLSPWVATGEIALRPKLAENATANVCVVGAGIAGMTTAYLLALAGKSVVVLDDGSIGGGMTGRTTAHLVTALDDRYFELEHLHGRKGARLAAESHRASIDKVESIVKAEKIDCEFERLDGFLFVPPGDSKEILEREIEAAQRAGLTDLEIVERAPIQSYDTGKALRFPRQAQFHPLKYLAGLARAIEREGGRIYN